MPNHQDEIVVRGGLSTRPREVLGAGYVERFTREALVGAAEQVASGYVRMDVEHLSFLPPVAHWHRAEVEDDDEDESELVVYGHYLPMRSGEDFSLPADEGRDASPQVPEQLVDVAIGIEPRNFDPEVWDSLKSSSPLPVVEQAARSILPPLIWIISVPVVWGVAQFAGGFLKRLGETAGDKLVTWLADHARRARDSSRDNLVEVQFEVARNVTVSAFIELTPSAQASVEELRRGLDGLGPVAHFAGVMKGNADTAHVRLVAFFYRDGVWHLGWWATEEAAHLTDWFQHNYPDPKRFLGGPYLVITEDDPTGPETLPPSSWIG